MKANKGVLLGAAAAAIAAAGVLTVNMTEKPEVGATNEAAGVAAAAASASAGAGSLVSAADDDSKQYYSGLLEKDLSASERATLLLAHLNRKYEQQLSSAASAYWVDGGKVALSIAAAERARSDVLSLIGESAWSDPALASLFQPYRREYPGLDPRKQVEAQRLIQRYFQAHEFVQADPGSYRERIAASYQELREGIEAALSPSERMEYVMRISPLADAVRRTRLEVSEPQFRELLARIDASESFTRLVLRLDGQRTSLSLYDPKLTELLGKDQHLAFISRIDPVYGALASLAKSRAAPPQQLQEVYAAFVEQQGESLSGPSESAVALARNAFGPSAELIIKQLVHQAART